MTIKMKIKRYIKMKIKIKINIDNKDVLVVDQDLSPLPKACSNDGNASERALGKKCNAM
jgi:hypothetical protein